MDLVIFDADGTLFDSVYFFVETYHQLYKHYGLFVPRSRIHHHIGMGMDKAIKRITPQVWWEQHAKDVRGKARHYFIKHFLDQVQVFPKTKEFINALHRDDKKVALATMSSSEVVSRYLDLLGKDVIFDFVTTSCDVKRSKPDPDIFLNVIDHFNAIPKEKMCVIGDSTWDILAANAAGIPALAVLTGGYPRNELEEAGAIHVKADIEELYNDYCLTGDSIFIRY
ncbi:MAG: HAD family hydrolase [Candidatus Omnitrophica bacterium]|nr:HAD family hydrolase [Candidatus Omnitrophota bacterium]